MATESSGAPVADSRVVRAWCLYDFGNSAFAVLFPVFYATYFVELAGGEGRGELPWSVLVAASMAVVALSSPFLGGVADHTGLRKRMLAVYTATAIAAVLGFAAVGEGTLALAFALGLVANVAFEGGIVFYNAYLPDIVPPARQGRVSAYGFAVGYAGSLVALGVAALLVETAGIRLVWIALALQWALAAAPAFRRLPADRRTGLGFAEAGRRGAAQTLATVRSVWGVRRLRRFLLAYFFYMDGVVTVIAFAAIVAKNTFAFGKTELVGMIALVQVSALAGSFLMARPTDEKGPGFTVRVVLLWWVAVVIAAALVEGKGLFWGVAVAAGLGLGSIQAASRAFMARLVPPGREAELFGFYALCGKTGSIVGPLLFGTLAAAFGSQRPAMAAVAALYAVGLLLLRGVSDRPVAEERTDAQG